MSGGRIADLHIHTTASDGAYGAAEVVRMAGDAGLEVIAITDHDSVEAFDGLEEGGDVEVIAGVELTAYFREREVHILGYFVDTGNAALCSMLRTLRKKRRARAYTIVRMLAEQDIDIPAGELFNLAGDASISRLHVAELLIDKGHRDNLYQVFRDFLGPEGSAFVRKPHFEVEEAIEIAHEAGGAAVLAHPRSNYAREDIGLFVEAGLDGIETFYPSHRKFEVDACLDIAAEFDLVATGGSDFHGRRYIDTPIGAMRVGRETVTKLFERSGRYASGRLS